MEFFYVGPPKEDIFSRHHLSPIIQSSFNITFTRLLTLITHVRRGIHIARHWNKVLERDSLTVSTLACHAADPGSNPAQSDDFFN